MNSISEYSLTDRETAGRLPSEEDLAGNLFACAQHMSVDGLLH